MLQIREKMLRIAFDSLRDHHEKRTRIDLSITKLRSNQIIRLRVLCGYTIFLQYLLGLYVNKQVRNAIFIRLARLLIRAVTCPLSWSFCEIVIETTFHVLAPVKMRSKAPSNSGC